MRVRPRRTGTLPFSGINIEDMDPEKSKIRKMGQKRQNCKISRTEPVTVIKLMRKKTTTITKK